MPHHVVRNQRGRNAVAGEFPCREPGALQIRARFGHEDRQRLVSPPRRPDDAQRRAVARGRQRAGVAMREHAGAARNQRRPVSAHTPVGGHVVALNLQRFTLGRADEHLAPLCVCFFKAAPHTLDRPEQVDRRRSCGRKQVAQTAELRRVRTTLEPPHPERDAHCRGHADGRRPADHHVADSAGNPAVIGIAAIDFARRQGALVDHTHRAVLPSNGMERRVSHS